jgi:hypothetical protein
MLGDGKSTGPDHVLYVGRLDAVDVSTPSDGRNRIVPSDTVDPVCEKKSVLVLSLTDPELSIGGNGKSPKFILWTNVMEPGRWEDDAALCDDDLCDNDSPVVESLGIFCFWLAATDDGARRICVLMA